MSSESFNRALVQRLLDLLWSLWQELGVLGRARPSPWAADPEALLLWTSWFGAADRRLEDAALEWVAEFEDLVNTSRLKIMYRSGVPCDPAALQRWFPKSDAAGAGTSAAQKQIAHRFFPRTPGPRLPQSLGLRRKPGRPHRPCRSGG
jgi:hypothetical protein